MKREVEVLWRLKSSLQRTLASLRALTFEGEKYTRDIYYYDPKRVALQPKRGRLYACFRLREKGGKTFLAYKVDHFRGDEWTYSDEHETEVVDGAVMADIIGHLGLRKLVEVDMVKHVFSSPEYEVAVEVVRGLGRCIEVESRRVVAARDVEKEKERIRRFLDGLGIRVGEEMNAGKPEMMLRKKGIVH